MPRKGPLTHARPDENTGAKFFRRPYRAVDLCFPRSGGPGGLHLRDLVRRGRGGRRLPRLRGGGRGPLRLPGRGPAAALAASPLLNARNGGEEIVVGEVTLTATSESPAYATTDDTGQVT